MFLSIDGGDGAGKSTQIELLCRWLRGLGFSVVTCRDPGSTPLGEAVREILLHRHELPLGPRSEMLLYMAARAQLVDEVIRPALLAGKLVICDRYLLANVVYQGYAGGLDPATVWQLGYVATDHLLPDLTIVLDVPVAVAAKRLAGSADRLESRGAEYHEKVRQGFLTEAARQPQQVVVVDASGTVEQVQSEIQSAVSQRLREAAPGSLSGQQAEPSNMPTRPPSS